MNAQDAHGVPLECGDQVRLAATGPLGVVVAVGAERVQVQWRRSTTIHLGANLRKQKP